LRGIGDIDVMVVGQVPQLDLFEVASRLQKDLGRVVQFNVYEPTSGATYARKRQLDRVTWLIDPMSAASSAIGPVA
jgi:hypothetical protein